MSDRYKYRFADFRTDPTYSDPPFSIAGNRSAERYDFAADETNTPTKIQRYMERRSIRNFD